MGLKSAPAIFVRAVTIALAPVLNKCLVLYCDDLLIVSPDVTIHLQDIKTVLCLLANLRAAPNKCIWFITKVSFTGHILEHGIIHPVPQQDQGHHPFPDPD
jgi:hypothetical protein